MTHRIKLLILSILAISLAACGSDKAGSDSSNDVSASKGCITGGCHETKASKVTGNAIGAEWNASSHKTTNIAGCTTCHGHYHSNSCGECHGGAQLQSPQQNSLDAEARCFDCHVSGAELMKGLDGKHLPELNSSFGTGSTYSLTSGWTTPTTDVATAAGWVVLQGTKYQSQCIWCHNPHDNRVLPQHQQWAESGHGSTTAGYLRSDFKMRGSPGDYRTEVAGDNCSRCHSTTGFINWVESGMKDVSEWGLDTKIRFGSSTTARTKQTIYCNVCHANGNDKAYGYHLRKIPAQGVNGGVRVWYNYSTSTPTAVTGANANESVTFVPMKVTNFFVDYPNIGDSDRCLLCHAGRASGGVIKAIAVKENSANQTVTFEKLSRISFHDFPAGGAMYKELGFEFYPAASYAQPAGRPYAHDQLGMSTNRGPCVACHMSSAESHSYEVVSFSNRTSAAMSSLANAYPVSSINTALCATCHASGGIGNPYFNGSVAALNAKKTGYGLSVKAVYAWLVAKSLIWARTNNGTTSATNTSNWVSQPVPELAVNYRNQDACIPPGNSAADFVVIGTRNMGASMNYDLKNDPGAFVHNDLYLKRILYDTIDWLDDCTMNSSTEDALDFTSNAAPINTLNLMMTLPALTPPRQTDFRLTPAEVLEVKSYLLDPVTGLRPGGD